MCSPVRSCAGSFFLRSVKLVKQTFLTNQESEHPGRVLPCLERLVCIPLLCYFIAFTILTFPLLGYFSTHFFTDEYDGLQNIWNLWWVNRAITEPGIYDSIWHTPLLHHPFGVTLRAHTLNPFNGLVGVVLLKFMTLIQVHNFIVIFSFVTGGWTAFLLAHHLTRSYGGSLVAGYVFTFSSYHFAHARGHLQLVSLEWIPLFILCWYLLMTRPRVLTAVLAGVALYLVILCDYYYFFYSVMSAILMVVWFAFRKRDPLFLFRGEALCPSLVFALVSCMLILPMVLPLMIISSNSPFTGAHAPADYSLDLLAPFIPGGHWFFRDLTRAYWSRLPGNINESSVHLGLSVLALLAYGMVRWRKLRDDIHDNAGVWLLVLFFFLLMGLGPVLRLAGESVWAGLMPYDLLEIVVPMMKLSGVPVRMMVMVYLAAAILIAAVFRMLAGHGPRHRVALGVLLALLFIEYLPIPSPRTRIGVPGYVSALKDHPGSGGVIDLISRWKTHHPAIELYYQTIHGKPMAFGYVSRITGAMEEKDVELLRVIHSRDLLTLMSRYQMNYMITDLPLEDEREHVRVQLLHKDGEARLYRFDAETMQEHLAAVFARSVPVHLGQDRFHYDDLQPVHESSIRATDHGYRILTTGPSPHILLPMIRVSDLEMGQYIMKFELEVPENTVGGVYYRYPGDDHYGEPNHVRLKLEKGMNTFFVKLDAEFFHDRLKFVPGRIPGEYLLKGYELRRIGN